MNEINKCSLAPEQLILDQGSVLYNLEQLKTLFFFPCGDISEISTTS